jgi:hypothetical protein
MCGNGCKATSPLNAALRLKGKRGQATFSAIPARYDVINRITKEKTKK